MPTYIALLAMVIGLVPAAPVRAASCEGPLGFHVLPSKGAKVPRNTRVWMVAPGPNAYPYEVRWTDSEEKRVAFSEQHITLADGQRILVLTPEQPLRHSESYEIANCWGDGRDYCETLTMFSTLDEIDTDPPALPDVEETARHAGENDWGKERLVTFSVPGHARAPQRTFRRRQSLAPRNPSASARPTRPTRRVIACAGAP